jgi:hypothetical protein
MTEEPRIRARVYEERASDQAATVLTEEGAWGHVPPPYRPPEQHTGAGPAWWLGALLVIAGALWLGALSLSQLSSRSVAIPAIERGVASLAEIDQLLSLHEEDLCRLAATDAPIEVPGYPVRGIDVRVSDIHCTDGKLDRDALRALLLTQSAEQVYLHGADAFLDDSGSLDDASILSASGGIRTILNSIGADMHDRATTAAWVLGGVSAVLFLATLLLGRGVRRFAGLGLALMLAALPMLLGALVVWAVLGAVDGGTGLTAQFAQITRSLLNLPIRNAFGLTAAGLALIVPALFVARAVQRARDADWWEYGRQ